MRPRLLLKAARPSRSLGPSYHQWVLCASYIPSPPPLTYLLLLLRQVRDEEKMVQAVAQHPCVLRPLACFESTGRLMLVQARAMRPQPTPPRRAATRALPYASGHHLTANT